MKDAREQRIETLEYMIAEYSERCERQKQIERWKVELAKLARAGSQECHRCGVPTDSNDDLCDECDDAYQAYYEEARERMISWPAI